MNNRAGRQYLHKTDLWNVLMCAEHDSTVGHCVILVKWVMIHAMCWKCGKAIQIDGPIGRDESCSVCGADTRSCRNCRFYAPGSWHDCAERVEDPVVDKERANFCDSFQLNPVFKTDHASTDKKYSSGSESVVRSAFDNLFKS